MNDKNPLLQRSMLTMGLWLYAGAFCWAYVSWVTIVWGYQGATYDVPETFLLFYAFLLVPIPSLAVPLGVARPTQMMYWLIYLAVYIPSLFAPSFMQLSSPVDLVLLSTTLAGGMFILGISQRLPLVRMNIRKCSPGIFWGCVFTLWLGCNAVLLIAYHGKMQLVGLAEVYDVRLAARQVTEAHATASYAGTLLGNAINPFVMAFGLATRKKSLVAAGAMDQVLIYATAAMKSIVVSPLIVIAVYVLVKRYASSVAVRMAFGLAITCVVLTTGAIGTVGGIAFNIATLVLFRTLAIPGVELGEYYDYFSHFPKTLYSNVTGVSWFVHNPYTLSLGREVAAVYVHNSAANANASFFAMDGIAALGLPGIIVISLVCALVFLAVDSCALDLKTEFVAASLAYTAVSLTNVSLFTTLLGNGLLLLMMLFLHTPDEVSKGYCPAPLPPAPFPAGEWLESQHA